MGVLLASLGGSALYKIAKSPAGEESKKVGLSLRRFMLGANDKQIIEDFSKPITAINGRSFGKSGQLTFELYRGGTFVIDGRSGFAWQKSNHYGDVALIRSTEALPKTYKIRVIMGEIDYDLDRIAGLPQDPEYPQGPQNENGCYLLAITDENPSGHHPNLWWHEHRKLVIDVDNNVWGNGMPHPIFMVYFNQNNDLVAFDGLTQEWQTEWDKAVTYAPKAWYQIEVEKTDTQFILGIYDERGKLLQQGKVELTDIWHEDESHQDYFVVGDPHENYYQGSMKIESIESTVIEGK